MKNENKSKFKIFCFRRHREIKNKTEVITEFKTKVPDLLKFCIISMSRTGSYQFGSCFKIKIILHQETELDR